MAKYIFTRPNGPWQYPTLGFTATLNDVIEANAAPDLWWELTDSGATVTLPAVPTIPGVVEPVDGAIGRWNRQTNEVEFVAQLPDENLPDRLQEAALASTIGSVASPLIASSVTAVRRRANLAVALGDSTVQYNGQGSTNTSQFGDGWFHQLCARTNQRILFGGRFATGGYTIEQVRDIHLPTVLALNPLPSWCFVLVGHNNSKSTTANFNAAKAAYIDIIEALTEAGIRPLIGLNIAHSYGILWNQWLTEYAARNGHPTFDGYSPTADPATEGVLSSLSVDTIHPNHKGMKAIAAKLIADGVADLFPPTPQLLTRTSADSLNLVGAKAIIGTDGNADGIDDRYTPISGGGTQTCSIVASVAGDGVVGSWQRIAKTSANTAVEGGLSWNSANRIRGRAPITSGVTFTDAGDIVTVPNHGAAVGDTVVFGTITGTTGITAGTVYYVKSVPSANTLTLSATNGGATLALTTDGTAASATFTVAGDVLEVAIKFRATGFEDNLKYYTLRMVQNGSVALPNVNLANQWRTDVADPATLCIRFTVDTAVAYLAFEARVESPAGATGTMQLDFANLTVYNLTTQQSLVDSA